MANSPQALINHKQDEDLIRDFHHIWHPCTQMKDHAEVPPLLIDRAEGIYLYDREGNRYMDVISSWWVNLFGHNHSRINQAIKDQLDKMAHVMFAGVTHQPAIDLAEKLVKTMVSSITFPEADSGKEVPETLILSPVRCQS